MRLEYTADEVLVIVTSDGHVHMLKPKEEGLMVVRDISKKIENSIIEGAKVHENSLLILTAMKKIYIIEDLNDCEPKTICEAYTGLFISNIINSGKKHFGIND